MVCQRCGCQEYKSQGRDAVIRRATELVRELKLTAENADSYEDCEIMAGLIVPFAGQKDSLMETLNWVSSLHEGLRAERYQAHLRATQDIFARLPVPGEPRRIVTTYHQLEQLTGELDEATIASLKDEEAKKAIGAVKQVHKGIDEKAARLKQRYGL